MRTWRTRACLARFRATRVAGLGALAWSTSAAAAEPAWLVWTHRVEEIDAWESRDVLETVWLDAAGAVVARRPAVVVAGGEGLWEHRWTAGGSCTCAGGSLSCPAAASVEAVDLVSGARAPAITLTGREPRVNDAHSVVLGSVGPYLFVRNAGLVARCGGAPFVDAEALVLDLSAGGAVVDLAAEIEAPAPASAPRAPSGTWHRGTEVLQIRPRWSEGSLSLRWERAEPTCKNCATEDLTDHRSTDAGAAAVPARLAPWTEAPAAVRAFLASQPAAVSSGWSEVPAEGAAWRALFEAPP